MSLFLVSVVGVSAALAHGMEDRKGFRVVSVTLLVAAVAVLALAATENLRAFALSCGCDRTPARLHMMLRGSAPPRAISSSTTVLA